MSRLSSCLLAGIFAVALAGSLDARPRIRFGGLAIGAGYSYGAFPYFSPFYYDPSGYAYQPNMGEVKLQTRAKNGEVFLNGAYAGEVSKLKSMWLDPGAYNLEIRKLGHSIYERRIYVLTGKTLKVRAPEK